LQRDIEAVEWVMAERTDDEPWAAWQRIRARLTPDRERVAIAICETFTEPKGAMWAVTDEDGREYWRACADAAIAAMGEP
jgi:hypothetical protein